MIFDGNLLLLFRLSILRSVRTGRLAKLSAVESGQFFRMDNEHNVHVIGIIIPYMGILYLLAWMLAYYIRRQSRAKQRNELKFPRL